MHSTRVYVRILFSAMAIYIPSNNILVPSLAHRSSAAYYTQLQILTRKNRTGFSGRFSNNYFEVHYVRVLQLIIC